MFLPTICISAFLKSNKEGYNLIASEVLRALRKLKCIPLRAEQLR
jgi:hypothetical protein